MFESAGNKGLVLAAANGKSEFDDKTFISSKIKVVVDFLNAVTNLFGEVDKKYSNIDLEPDVYSIKVGQYSGSFVFDQSGKIFCRPTSDITIIPGNMLQIDGNNHLAGFTVETPDGMVYTFGQPDLTFAGELNIKGVEFTENTIYTLPNYLTYDHSNFFGGFSDVSHYFGARIDQTSIPYRANILCLPRSLQYGSTYENLYTVMKSPKYISTWKLTSISSKMTQEEVDLEYSQVDDLNTFSSKSITHKFPNFKIGDTRFETPRNFRLNLIQNTEYSDLKGEFTYTAVETNLSKQRLTSITSNRLESIRFIYDQERLDMVGDRY